MRGDPRIFRHRYEERDVNTRVVWLLDRSSSMEIDDRIQIARQSVLAAAATLESIPGIAQAVGAFPGDQSEVTLITDFGQSVKRTAAYYHDITPSGGTPALVRAVNLFDGATITINDGRRAVVSRALSRRLIRVGGADVGP